MKNQPVFLCAATRSGSTMLHLMMDFHPSLKNPGEFDFLFDRVSESGEFPTVQAYKNWLSTNRIFHSKNLKISTSDDYKSVISAFIEQLAEPDKQLTFNVHRRFGVIPFVFHEAKYIHLIRDPRDVARSSIGMGWAGNVYYGVDNWVNVENAWLKLKPQLKKEQYIELKYEDLIADTENVLTTICEFCGLKYDEAMLAYNEDSHYEKPDPNLTYQWKRKLSQKDIQLVESKTREQIKALGYELSEFPEYEASFFDKLSLLLNNKLYRLKFNINRYGLGLFLSLKLTSALKMQKQWQKYRLLCNEIDKQHLR